MKDNRYKELYRINSFPFQRGELHKIVMAYHFSLNAIIAETDNIHRLPFLLDAVLKGYIDQTNLDLILSFIGSNSFRDTQTFISISDHKKELNQSRKIKEKPFEAVKVNEVNSTYFSNKANVIYAGNGGKERSFFTALSDFKRSS